jgi:nucleoside-diphosphate-sugar epimerase
MDKKIQSKILITGSNGFVGESLYKKLKIDDHDVIGSVRSKDKIINGQKCVIINDLNSQTTCLNALDGCDTVVHLAGRAHILNDKIVNPLEIFRNVNTDATLNLAEQAFKAGVKKFIFLSSIGVNGSSTNGVPYTINDTPLPHSPYAISKFEAEKGLDEISKRTGLQVIIIRSPAIYGKNAPGNFGLIEKFIRKGIPMPVGLINNKRSLVSIENLTDFISVIAAHPKKIEGVFFVSDGCDLSTLEIVKIMGEIIDKKARIFRFPLVILNLFFSLLGKKKSGDSLMLDFQFDISVSLKALEWDPPFKPLKLLESINKIRNKK